MDPNLLRSIETAKHRFMRQKNNMHHAHLHPIPDAAGRPPNPIRCRRRRSICGSASTLSARRHSCMNPPESGCACAHAGMRSRRPPKPRTDSPQAVPGDVHRCHRVQGAESEQADQAGSSIVLVRVRATIDGIIELLQPARPRSVLLRQGLARGHVPQHLRLGEHDASLRSRASSRKKQKVRVKITRSSRKTISFTSDFCCAEQPVWPAQENLVTGWLLGAGAGRGHAELQAQLRG